MKSLFVKSRLRYDAEELQGKIIERNEILAIDRTEDLLDEIDYVLENKQLINWAVLGSVAHGKSTIAMALAETIAEKMKTSFNIENIAHDQIDFSRKALQVSNTILITDEYSTLAEVGLNASVEQKFYEHYSDVFAQQYVHRISCSPRKVLDPNVSVIRDNPLKDQKKKKSVVEVYYRIRQGENYVDQLVGTAVIDVKKVLEKEYYKKYREIKFKKMELVKKERIRHRLDLELAELCLAVFTRLKPLARIGAVSRGTISHFVEMNKPTFLSIIATDYVAREIEGALGWVSTLAKIEAKKKKIETKDKITSTDQETLLDINTSKKVIEEQLKLIEDNYRHRIELKEEYEKIIGEKK